MSSFLVLCLGTSIRLVLDYRGLVLENSELRKQQAVFKRRHRQLRRGTLERHFGVVARRIRFGWKRGLLIVTPGNVVRWRRVGFRLYWGWVSRA